MTRYPTKGESDRFPAGEIDCLRDLVLADRVCPVLEMVMGGMIG